MYEDRADQLQCPYGLFVDEDQTVYIANCANHSIVAWKADATAGEVLAGGKGWGNRLDQETDSLLICDRQNRRVMRWPRLPSSHRRPEIVISNISCFGLTIDNQGSLYVSDYMKYEVRTI